MRTTLPAFLALVIALALAPAAADDKPDPRAQVFAAESSFAATMASRDSVAFESFVATDAIFFGGRGPLRGREAVVAAWRRFFRGPNPPFSWRPEVVEALSSGTLALSSGPVHDPEGNLIGKFNSIWRLDSDGRWRVVFDKGCDVCDTTKTK
jgi:ketosteroid isomerase-like protein